MVILRIPNIKNFFDVGALFPRLRYPYSMPTEIGEDLGISLDNRFSFNAFLKKIRSQSTLPKNLYKFMPQDEVRSIFRHARKTDDFKNKISFCYYFREGWVEFEAFFDQNNRLCRMLFAGKEIPLKSTIV